jgi:hypothetical protein
MGEPVLGMRGSGGGMFHIINQRFSFRKDFSMASKAVTGIFP